jgi:predicted kinase
MKTELLDWLELNEPTLFKAMETVEHGYLGEEPNPYHLEGTVLTHTKMVMTQAQKFNTIELYICAMLHDSGKPFVFEDNDETRRRRFTNHEAVSTFIAKPILDKLLETYIFDKDIVIKTIARHGSLYNYMSNGRILPKHFNKIASMFKTSYELKMLRDFFYCDHTGRIQEVAKVDIDDVMGDFNTIIKIIDDSYKGTEVIPKEVVTVLIGLPRSGKSTYVANKYPDGTAGLVDVISRDDLVMEFGEGETYSEKWKSLTDELQKDIDKKLMENFHKSSKVKNPMIIDMTNMSKKSRRKWLNDSKMKDYYKQAVVFIEPLEVLMGRMTDDKNIPEGVIRSMMRSFVFPDYTEFDHIEIFQG